MKWRLNLILTERPKLWVGGVVSLLVHILLLLALAFLVIAGQSANSQPNFLIAFQADKDGDSNDMDFEISPMTVSEVEVTATESKQPSLASDVKLAASEMKISIDMPVAEVASSLDDWRLFEIEPSVANRIEKRFKAMQTAQANMRHRASKTGAMGNALSAEGGSANQKSNSTGAQYFGARAHGKKFVFVVDGSGSMVNRATNGIRWTTATQELLRSLHDLRSDYEFFVICFNVAEHPIFDHYPPNNRYLKNEPDTLRLVEEWITDFRPGGNTYPSRALQMAIEMQPDSIFLLSDGEIRDDSIDMLRRLNRGNNYGKPRVPIHTILLMSEFGMVTLKTIADENGGEFRNVTYQEWLAAQAR